MLFSGIPFLYRFLPVTLLLYYAAPIRYRNAVLLAASLVFYAWGEPKYILLMAACIFAGYGFGRLIFALQRKAAKRAALLAAICFNLLLLGYFKYAGFLTSAVNLVPGIAFTIPKIALPIGISFYTFQLISYYADVYRGTVAPQRSVTDFALYISFFAQLIAGPIVRYTDFLPFLQTRSVSAQSFCAGLSRFITGLSKKVLLANSLGALCEIFYSSAEQTVLFYWLYAVAFTLHIYFDFSGYSDMAIGLGKLFGFRLPENFDYPYLSKSVTEFWRRWHMTLGGWFRDYVYIPLGGSRCSRTRRIVNLLIVWTLTGLWHGASWNFAAWGLFYGILLILEKFLLLRLLEKAPRFLRHLYTLLVVCIGFVLFNAADLPGAFRDIAGMFGLRGLAFSGTATRYYLKSNIVLLLLGVLGSTPWLRTAQNKLQSTAAGRRFLALSQPIVLAFLLLSSTAYLVDGSFNPFLYFRF